MQNISVKKMSVFVSTVDEGSFTRGAAKSNISQPAAISIINEIEETVGEDLFLRVGKTRRAQLTARGQDVYDTLVRALSAYHAALENISLQKSRATTQTILIQSPYATSVSSQWLRNLVADAAGDNVSIQAADWQHIMNEIKDGRKCIALLDGETRSRNCDYFQLDTIEMCFVAPKALNLGREGQIAWEEVPAETVVYSGISPRYVKKICDRLRRASGDERQSLKTNNQQILRAFVVDLGLPAIVPQIMVPMLGRDNIDCLEFESERIHLPLGMSVPFGFGNSHGDGRHRLRRMLNVTPEVELSPAA